MAATEKKYPKSTLKQRGDHNDRFYRDMGVERGNRRGAANRMSKLTNMYEKGEAVNEAELRQVGAEFGHPVKQKTKGPTSKDTDRQGPQSNALPQKAAEKEIATVQNKIDAPAWQFKGKKAPTQEDIDLVQNAEGDDRMEALRAFENRFGTEAVDAHLGE